MRVLLFVGSIYTTPTTAYLQVCFNPIERVEKAKRSQLQRRGAAQKTVACFPISSRPGPEFSNQPHSLHTLQADHNDLKLARRQTLKLIDIIVKIAN